MNKILVIIDCQNGTVDGSYHGSLLKSDTKWMSRYNSMLSNIKLLSSKYSKVIFLVHNDGFKNKTRTNIVKELESISLLKKSKIVYKYQDDGSSVINEYIRDNDVDIVGMNTDACVLKTSFSSLNIANSVSIIKDACWTVYSATNNIFNRPYAESHNQAIRKAKINGINILSMKEIIIK